MKRSEKNKAEFDDIPLQVISTTSYSSTKDKKQGSNETFKTIPAPPSHLKNWMENIPIKLQSVPIWKLYIPGSHDSGTYGLDIDSGIAPDKPCLENSFLSKSCKCIVLPTMYNWTKTQNLTVTEQLISGIRYLDMRVSSRPNDHNLYFVHGLYGPVIYNILSEINNFLVSNTKEILFIDFQHFYRMSDIDHQNLIKFVTDTFSDRLVPYSSQLMMDKITLSYLWNKRQQVFVYYRDEQHRLENPNLWPGRCLPNPWANTINTDKLSTFLSSQVDNRPPNSMFVTQGVLTPDNRYIVFHLCSSLEKDLVHKCNRTMVTWLKERSEKLRSPNIVMCDMIQWQNYEIPCMIVKLNSNYLK